MIRINIITTKDIESELLADDIHNIINEYLHKQPNIEKITCRFENECQKDSMGGWYSITANSQLEIILIPQDNKDEQ